MIKKEMKCHLKQPPLDLYYLLGFVPLVIAPYDTIFLQIKGLHILSSFLSSKSSGLIELYVELIEEGMQFIDVKSSASVGIILIEHLVDEHSENIVVQS